MSSLERRMKDYESASAIRLTKRVPVIARIDGVSFSKFTKHLMFPFDDKVFLQAMRDTMKELCDGTQGIVFAYTQSDEISFIFQDTSSLDYIPIYDYRREKMASVIAGRVSVLFYKNFVRLVNDVALTDNLYKDIKGSYLKAVEKAPCFDCRVFNVPLDDVINSMIWRQENNINNSVSQLSQSVYSHKQLLSKSKSDKIEMLKEVGKDWNDLPSTLKYGTFCYKVFKQFTNQMTGETVERKKFELDVNTNRLVDNSEILRSNIIWGSDSCV